MKLQNSHYVSMFLQYFMPFCSLMYIMSSLPAQQCCVDLWPVHVSPAPLGELQEDVVLQQR